MKRNHVVVSTFFAIICAISINKPSFAEPANLSLLREEVKVYHDSGAYQQDLDTVINCAHDFIIKRASSNAHRTHPEKLAIVLDIDETSLSNYDVMVKHEFVIDHELIHQVHLAADTPVIKPMLSLYDDAIKHGVSVFFITGRNESERKATAQNLTYAGYHDWAGLYLRPKDYQQTSAIPFKSEARATISKQGYDILASIGDQDSDLKGGYAEKTYKLPNPYYYIP